MSNFPGMQSDSQRRVRRRSLQACPAPVAKGASGYGSLKACPAPVAKGASQLPEASAIVTRRTVGPPWASQLPEAPARHRVARTFAKFRENNEFQSSLCTYGEHENVTSAPVCAPTASTKTQLLLKSVHLR